MRTYDGNYDCEYLIFEKVQNFVKKKIGINSKMYMECEYLLRKGTRDTDLLKQANDNLKSS